MGGDLVLGNDSSNHKTPNIFHVLLLVLIQMLQVVKLDDRNDGRSLGAYIFRDDLESLAGLQPRLTETLLAILRKNLFLIALQSLCSFSWHIGL